MSEGHNAYNNPRRKAMYGNISKKKLFDTVRSFRVQTEKTNAKEILLIGGQANLEFCHLLSRRFLVLWFHITMRQKLKSQANHKLAVFTECNLYLLSSDEKHECTNGLLLCSLATSQNITSS